MRRDTCVLGTMLLTVIMSACGGGGGSTPTAPSGGGGAAPSNLQITTQQVTLTANLVTFSWTGTSQTHRIAIGTSSQMSNVHTADVTGTTYQWTAPREANAYYVRVTALTNGQTSAASNEQLVFTIDLRHVIDALFFRSGPMSDNPSAIPGNTVAGVWADGTHLTVPIEMELGQTTKAFADRFLSDYAAVTGGAVTATSALTADDLRSFTTPSQVPEFSIPTRILNGYCSATALACAFYGPAPLGLNRSIVTMLSATPNALRAMAHELGHAYGMGHVRVTAAVRAELNFMMNPTLVSDFMTETEISAISAARGAGLRAGWTRNQALAAGLVLASSSSAYNQAAALLDSGSRDADRCTIIGGGQPS